MMSAGTVHEKAGWLDFSNTPGDEREGDYFSTASPAASQPDLPAERCFTLV
jgi:hypothetical protein